MKKVAPAIFFRPSAVAQKAIAMASRDRRRPEWSRMEGDDEVFGEDIAINYTFRMHDARIGRFLSIDPLAAKYPWNSPYAFSENRVIQFIELEGLETADPALLRAERAVLVVTNDNRTYKMVSGDASRGDDFVDCSEFCREITEYFSIDPGRDSRSQARYYQGTYGTYSDDIKDLEVGDFVFWKALGEDAISHTGIVTSDNGDGTFKVAHAHVANRTGKSLKITNMAQNGDIWGGAKVFVGLGRPIFPELQANNQSQAEPIEEKIDVDKTMETIQSELYNFVEQESEKDGYLLDSIYGFFEWLLD